MMKVKLEIGGNNEIIMEDLKKEDGIKTLFKFLDIQFKKDELTEVYKAYVHFDK